MSLLVFYYCICACLRCRQVSIHLCHLSPFHLFYVALSRQCRLSEFTLTGPHDMQIRQQNGVVNQIYQQTTTCSIGDCTGI